jgi:hypothetical protein
MCRTGSGAPNAHCSGMGCSGRKLADVSFMILSEATMRMSLASTPQAV